MEKLTYYPKGTCSNRLEISYEGNIISEVAVSGGCLGSSQGISALIKGMSIDEAIKRLEGIQCRNMTSCPDQIARALKEIKR